jgi:hypothetical protein
MNDLMLAMYHAGRVGMFLFVLLILTVLVLKKIALASPPRAIILSAARTPPERMFIKAEKKQLT